MDSPYMTKIQHKEFAKRMEDEHIRIHHRLNGVEKRQEEMTELTLSVHDLANSLKESVEIQKKHGEDIEELKGKDGQSWRDVKRQVLMVIIGIIIGIVANQLGL